MSTSLFYSYDINIIYKFSIFVWLSPKDRYMTTTGLHPQIIEIQKKLSGSGSLNVRFKDYAFQVSSLNQMIQHDIVRQKKVLVIGNNKTSLNHLYESLSKGPLKKLSLNLYGQTLLHQEHIQNIRATVKEEVSRKESKEIIERDLELQLVDQLYFKNVQNVFGDRNWEDVLNRFAEIKHKHPQLPEININVDSLEFNQKEYYSFLGRIEYAAKKHRKDFDLLQSFNSDIFNESTLIKLNREESNSRIRQQLEILLELGLKIKLELESKITQVIKARERFYRQEILDLYKESIRIQKEIALSNVSQLKQKKSFFRKSSRSNQNSYKILIDSISDFKNRLSDIGVQLEFTELNNDFFETLELSFDNVRFELLNIEMSHAKNKTSFEFKGLNLLNSQDEDLGNIVNKMTDYFDKVNKSKLFKSDFVFNTHSLVKLQEVFNKTTDKLRAAYHDLISKSEYLEWSAFTSDLHPTVEKLIDQICHIPKNLWSLTYEKWYLGECLTYKGKSYRELFDLRAIPFAGEDYFEKRIPSVIENNKNQFKEELETWSRENKSLYQEIIKKKSDPQITLQELLGTNAQWIFKLYPICILHENDIENIDLSQWNMIYNIGSNNKLELIAEQECLNVLDNLDDNTNVINAYEIPNEEFASLLPAVRINRSKKIALELLKINPNIRCFQNKNHSIIYTCSPLLEDIVLDHFNHDILKEMPNGDDLFNSTVEALLETDKTQIIITDKGLINRENVYWQYQLNFKHLLKSIGFKTIDLCLVDYFEHSNSSNIDLLQTQLTQEQEAANEILQH